MFLREHEMIDMVTDYLAGPSNEPLYIGAMIGTQVFKHVLDISLNYTDFGHMLIMEGIQDFIGMRKESQYSNHIFYAERFHNELIELSKDRSTIQKFFKDKDNIKNIPVLDNDIHADILIINDAHMIPRLYLDQILSRAHTKIILIVDPFDINGEPYSNVYTVTETLTASSNLIAKARQLYDVETYAIDKKVYSVLDTDKLSKRSIGKIDDNQYVTNDESLQYEINLRQVSSGFKKKQKILIMDDHIISSPSVSDEPVNHECILTKHSLAYIMGVDKNSPYVRLRPHSYKQSLFGRPTYDLSNDDKTIHCTPANLLSINESAYHRFQHIICVVGENPLTIRQMYSLLKDTNHLTIVK